MYIIKIANVFNTFATVTPYCVVEDLNILEIFLQKFLEYLDSYFLDTICYPSWKGYLIVKNRFDSFHGINVTKRILHRNTHGVKLQQNYEKHDEWTTI